MVLAVLDDLIFTSKLRAAARVLDVPLAFARTKDAALDDMRARHPSLVILDLNNARTDPMGTVTAMKSDAALASIATVGFVSHVDVEVMDLAREAGVDTILPRSAFTARLNDILAPHR